MVIWALTVEGYPVLPTVGLSLGWVVTTWFVVRLLTGKLMTLTAHNEQVAVIRASYDREVETMRDTFQHQVDDIAHDRSEWRTEGRIKDSTINELLEQKRGLLESIAGTVVATFDAIKDNARETRGGAS